MIKKPLFLLLLFTFSNFVNAQSELKKKLNDLIIIAEKYFEQKEYQEAIANYNKVLNIVEESKIDDDIYILISFEALRELYLEQKKYLKAANIFIKLKSQKFIKNVEQNNLINKIHKKYKPTLFSPLDTYQSKFNLKDDDGDERKIKFMEWYYFYSKANTLQFHGKGNKAIVNYEKAYLIAEKLFKNHPTLLFNNTIALADFFRLNENKINQAIELYNKALFLTQKNENYLNVLMKLAFLLQKININDSQNYIEEFILLNGKLFKKDTYEYRQNLLISASYYALIDIEKSKAIYQELIKLTNELEGENEAYFYYLFHYTDILFNNNNTDEALEKLNRVINYYIEVQNFKGLAASQLSLASYYKRIEEYQNAVKYQEIGISNFKKDKGNLYSLNIFQTNLASYYSEIGETKKSIEILKKSFIWFKENVDITNPQYYDNLSRFGEYYYNNKELNKSKELFIEVLKGYKSMDVKDSRLLVVLQNLGNAHYQLGEYHQAISYFSKAESKAINGKEKSLLNDGAALRYINLGQYKKAQAYYNKAEKYYTNEFKKSLDYANHLTIKLQEIGIYGDYDRALSIIKKAQKIYKTKLGKNQKYIEMLTRKAYFEMRLNNFDDALLSVIKAKIIISDIELEESFHYVQILGVEAQIYGHTKNYAKALSQINKAIGLQHKLTRYEDDAILFLESTKASIFLRMKKYDEMIAIYFKNNKKFLKKIESIFSFSTEDEKASFIASNTSFYNLYQSINIITKENFPRLTKINFNNQLLYKNLILNKTKNILEDLKSLNNNELNNKIKSFKYVKDKISYQSSLSEPMRTLNLDSIIKIRDKFEYELVKQHDINFKEKENYNWKNILSNLKGNETAIEFSHFNYHNGKKWTDSIMYVAYLINKNWEAPKMIPLFEERQLKKTLYSGKANITYALRGGGVDVGQFGEDIYNLVMKPLEPYIKDSKMLYYSPSGLLHQVSFAGLSIDSTYLNQKFNLVQLSSTAKLTEKRDEPRQSTTLFIGDINYDYKPKNSQKEEDISIINLDMETLKTSKSNQKRELPWKHLDGTKTELDSVTAIYKTRNLFYKKLTDYSATEEAFKKLDGDSPNILHIATHGFFFENLKKETKQELSLYTNNQYKLAEDPLLRSGLVLARANYAWQHGSNPYEKEDGILTALEISNMDLSKTDIVILSACKTGLGDIDGSEGVYGLQRAFKMAGVDIIIMSLWNVPDNETAEFINLFYNKWFKSNNVRKSFNDTQKIMQEKYKDEPEKWAAFVMFE